mmetsp:Transcript_45579/g.95681  ORF Transcript_45579/g.95681 Transcript_45579/m.95681 type:complete len:256 (+) Transcript_45579:129-896(+)
MIRVQLWKTWFFFHSIAAPYLVTEIHARPIPLASITSMNGRAAPFHLSCNPLQLRLNGLLLIKPSRVLQRYRLPKGIAIHILRAIHLHARLERSTLAIVAELRRAGKGKVVAVPPEQSPFYSASARPAMDGTARTGCSSSLLGPRARRGRRGIVEYDQQHSSTLGRFRSHRSNSGAGSGASDEILGLSRSFHRRDEGEDASPTTGASAIAARVVDGSLGRSAAAAAAAGQAEASGILDMTCARSTGRAWNRRDRT